MVSMTAIFLPGNVMAKRLSKTEQAAADAEELYLQKAAAQIPYPVDIYNKTIDVPDNEVDQALEHLMIQQLCGARFRFAIQRCIPDEVVKKEVYDPKLREVVKPVEVVEEAFVKIGDQFLVNNQVTLEVRRIEGDVVYTKALNQMASESPIGILVLKEMVKRKTWERL